MIEMTRQQRIPELTLGWRLRMAAGGLTDGEMADAMNVSRKTVYRWMVGTGTPPHEAFVRHWALITGTDPEWLLTGATKNPRPVDEGSDVLSAQTLGYVDCLRSVA